MQNSNQGLDLFKNTSPPVPVFFTSSPFQHSLSVTRASVSPTTSSTTSFAVSLPGPVFPAPCLLKEPVAMAAVTVPQPLIGSVLTSTATAALPYSTAASVTPQQVSTAVAPSQSASLSLSDNLQDLALLDLCSPEKWVVHFLLGTQEMWITLSLSIWKIRSLEMILVWFNCFKNAPLPIEMFKKISRLCPIQFQVHLKC